MNPSDNPLDSVTYKTARAAEIFWLVASIATTLYVAYMWWAEELTQWTLGLFPCISWLWYGVRRAFRIKMARPQ